MSKVMLHLRDKQGMEWTEDHEPPKAWADNALAWAEKLVEAFNVEERERYGTKANIRTLERVDILGGASQHVWTKYRAMTQAGRGGAYDAMQCKRCGVTGRRYGLSGSVVRDRQYKAAIYDDCTVAKQQIERLAMRRKAKVAKDQQLARRRKASRKSG